MAKGTARAASVGLPADRVAARVLAHTLIEQTQVSPDPELLLRLVEEAREAGWGEVQVLLLHCRLIHAGLAGEADDELWARSDAMLAAAEATGEEILIALALASRALFLAGTDHPESLGEDLGGCLARAVAMLDEATATDLAELGMRAVELPACFVECGQAYHQLGLWELEEEMYVRAAAALEIPVDDAVRPVGVFTRRVLVVNRLEATAALACALVEIGERETARQVAAARLRPTPAERADLPPGWDSEVRAMERLLAVISGDADVGDPASVPADLFDELETSVRTCYRASLLLAAAVGAHDAGAIASAARLADQAVGMLDDYKPSLRTLALRLAAEGAECDDAARRYAQQLALLRWQSRLQVLGSARARRAAALVLREGEQLSRQAYVDALTGLANRHAQSRHLARLRRSDPHDRLGVVLIDVDHFKTINDSFGHAVGDEVLRVIGGALQAAVRASDLAVRLGGDEFMLLLDLKSPTDVAARAHAIVDAVSSHRWGDLAPGLSVTISAGQATGATREVDDVMKAADVNLYRAKAAGRGRAVTAARSRGAVPVRQRAAAREPEVPGTVR